MESEQIKTYVALLSFERGEDVLNIIPKDCHGASGWMAVRATDEWSARQRLCDELDQIGLRLIETADLTQVSSADEVERIDAHLAANMRMWESGRSSVWGTLHPYIGDGEA